MLQTLGFPAGGRSISAKAAFFRYESSSSGGADDSIKLTGDGQVLGVYYPGDAVRLPEGETFSRWEISPTTPTTTGVVRLGMATVESARLVGVVRTVDGEREKVLAGVCFRGVCSVGSPGSGGAAGELWNPATSGKNIFVQAVTVGSSGGDAWTLGTMTVQLPNAAAATPQNLDRGNTASVALLRSGSSADPLGVTQILGSGYVAASTDRIVVLPRPILLRPGYGCLIYINTTVNTMRAMFEWEEWPVTQGGV